MHDIFQAGKGCFYNEKLSVDAIFKTYNFLKNNILCKNVEIS